MASPSSRRATKRRRSSITELAFHGIHTSRLQKSEKCNPCVRYEMSPMSRAAHPRQRTFGEQWFTNQGRQPSVHLKPDRFARFGALHNDRLDQVADCFRHAGLWASAANFGGEVVHNRQ